MPIGLLHGRGEVVSVARLMRQQALRPQLAEAPFAEPVEAPRAEPPPKRRRRFYPSCE